MNVEKFTVEELTEFAERETWRYKRRDRFQSIGYAIFGLCFGQLIGFIFFPKVKWGGRGLASFEAVVLVVMVFVLIYNWKCRRAHRAAALHLIGMVRARKNPSLLAFHHEHAQAAFADLKNIRPFKKDEDSAT